MGSDRLGERFRIAVDIGGTFTDIALLTDRELVHQSKLSSTPGDPSAAVVAGVAQLLVELSIPPDVVAEVLHGTTVGSNTILQRKGAKTGLITTRGFRDVLEIGRIRMPDMFDLTWDKPKPLVARRHRMEVTERMAADGVVIEPLSEATVLAATQALVAEGIEAVAIAFINSYRNPAHEVQAEAILRSSFPHLLVTTSCSVLPEMKEYERTSTTVVNAYLLAAMRAYLGRPDSTSGRLDGARQRATVIRRAEAGGPTGRLVERRGRRRAALQRQVHRRNFRCSCWTICSVRQSNDWIMTRSAKPSA
jgi:N-methylhydantoinase A